MEGRILVNLFRTALMLKEMKRIWNTRLLATRSQREYVSSRFRHGKFPYYCVVVYSRKTDKRGKNVNGGDIGVVVSVVLVYAEVSHGGPDTTVSRRHASTKY